MNLCIVLIQFRWNNFWFYNGEAITYLSWIVKYKDYINTNDKNIVQKQMKKVESEINIVKEFDKSRKFINSSLLSAKFKMCYKKSKLNFVIVQILIIQSPRRVHYSTCKRYHYRHYLLQLLTYIKPFREPIVTPQLYRRPNAHVSNADNRSLQPQLWRRLSAHKNSKNEIKTTCNTSNNCIYNSNSAIDKDNRKHIKLKCKEVKYSNIQTDLYYNDKENYKHKELLQFNSNSAVDLQHNSVFKKYWLKRYQLFSKFDDGIQLDYESWFSVTPEKIAKHIAKRCRCDILIDAFSGAGGNSIHFTSTCQIVYAIDIDPQKIAMTKHNAQIYNVNDKIEYILGDYFCLVDKLIGDVVFLSPPWGGPSYINNNVYDIRNIMSPIGGLKLLEISKIISNNIAFYLPKNINILELVTAGGPGSKIEVEQNFINNKLVAITAYYGNLLK
ncbi:PREDICTED: uncharacterized protein LOC105368457 [Ceratosolen solmsi marchali]|uniref:Trimethylguanosine synthase n=1 Tax=Ceratosolen solmsi marchali TaxID=326594 RepID=A0AAJ6YWT8_9HYME|nr:PREDICTED: uncharacterized protein LOC105368457 [Ceratosolen solmsi marchali]